MTALRVLTAVGSALALVGTVHQLVNLRSLRVPAAEPPDVAEPVSVLVPARDEAHRITPTVRSLLAQRGVPDLEILVLDDGSTDGTADVVRAAAAGDPRLRVLTGTPARARPAGQAARLRPARGRRPRPRAGASSTPTSCWPRTPSPPRSRSCGRAGSTCCPRGRASSPTASCRGWCSRCCVVVVVRCRCDGPSGRRTAVARAPPTASSSSWTPPRSRGPGGFAAVAGDVLDDIALARAIKPRRRAASAWPTARASRPAACTRAAGARAPGTEKSLWAAFGPPGVRGGRGAAGAGLPRAAARGPGGLPDRARRVRRRGGEPGARRPGHRWPAWPDALAHPAVGRRAAGPARARRGAGTGGGELTWKGRRAAGEPASVALTWRGSSSSARASGGWPRPPGSPRRATRGAARRAATHGGKLGEFRRDGFTFDTGPSLLTMPQVFTDLFAATGGPPGWSVEPVDPVCRYRFADGTRLDLPYDPAAVPAALDGALGPGAGAAWQAFHDRSARLWDLVGEPVLHRPLARPRPRAVQRPAARPAGGRAVAAPCAASASMFAARPAAAQPGSTATPPTPARTHAVPPRCCR